MKRLFLILGLLVGVSQAQTTTTITGTIKDLSQALVTSGKVTFTLQPSRDTTISGLARFSPAQVVCLINASGLIKAQDGTSVCTLTMNTALNPPGTYYRVDLWPFNVKTSSFTFYAVLSTYDWSTVVPTPTTSPAQNFVDIFSNQTIGGNKTFTGNLTLQGTVLASGNWTWSGQNSLTAYNINGAIYVDGLKFPIVAAAYATINSGQVLTVPCGPNGTPYTETLAANLVLGKAQTGIWFVCGGALTLGPFNIQVPAGVNGVSIISLFGKNSSPGGSNAGFTLTGYTGTGAAVQVGASTADTVDFTMKGIGISMSSAGAGAIGIQLNRTQDFYLENPTVAGMVASANVGIQINGTGSGSYAGNGAIVEPVIFGGGATNQIGIQGTGPSVGSPQGMNAVRIFGGHISLNGASGTSACFDFFAANGNGIFWTDCENAANGITIEATQNPALLNSFLRIENVTNIVNFAAGTDGNKFSTDNVTGAIINSGLGHNQVFQPLQTNVPQAISSGTASMTTAAIGAGACGTTVSVLATGALTTDTINHSFNAAVAANPGVLTFNKWPTADHVNFNYCNPTTGSVTPSAATVNWSVVR